MKYIPLLILFLAFSFNIKSQDLTDFIIINSNDTLRGEVLINKKETSPLSIEFLSSGNSITYSPEEIKEVNMADGTIYHSAEIEYFYYTKSEFDRNNVRLSKTETVFMEAIVLGSLSLYEYVDLEFNSHLMIKTPDGEVEELIQKHSRNNTIITYTREYVYQLKRHFGTCPDFYKKIDKANLNRSSIRKIVLDYYVCKNLTPSYILAQRKFGISLHFNLGLSITNLKKRSLSPFGAPDDINNSIAPTAEFGANFKLPHNNAWAIMTSIGYRSYEAPVFLNYVISKD